MYSKISRSDKYPRLFEPGYIGNMWVKNRIIKAPMTTGMGGRDGSVTPRLVRYYKEIALGGTGLIIVGYSWIDFEGSKSIQCQIGIADDEFIPGLAWLAQTIQQNGAKAALQIEHCGRQKFLGTPPIKSVSRVPWEELTLLGAAIPEELTFEEVLKIVEDFGDAARRTMMAGFDMVEIHGAHGYLITSFLSPRTNKRNDWYGGSLENRMRFLLEIIENVKSKVGPDYPVGVRLSGSEYEPDGIEIEETIQVAKALEKSGIDVIHISGGNHHTGDHEVVPMYLSLAHNVWAAEAVKKEVGISVIASGSITTPELAEEILESEKGDFVALGRPLFADPHFANKTAEGRAEQIAPCIRCNDGCLMRGLYPRGAVQCTVNVALGKEDEFRITSAESPKKIAIIGGGPAGLEAAKVACLRGHKVTLYEKRKLGGRLIEASVPDFKADIRALIKYLITQVEKLKVKVIYEETDPEKIAKEGYDSLIIAAGGIPIIPDVPGIENSTVVSALDVLNGGLKKLGQNIMVVGGGWIGAETAWFLAQNEKKIVIIEMLDELAPEITFGRSTLLNDFEKYGVRIFTGWRLEKITEEETTTVNKYGEKMNFTVDNVVLALGFSANEALVDKFAKSCNEIYVVGDCANPRKIFDAIHEGHIAAIWI